MTCIYIRLIFIQIYVEFGISLVPDSDQKDLSDTGNKILYFKFYGSIVN